MYPIVKFLGDTNSFLQQVFLSLKKDSIDVSNYEIDHICYRVETQDTYHKLKYELSKYAILLTEAHIGGRPISSFKLKEPIMFRDRKIDVIELPALKKDASFLKVINT